MIQRSEPSPVISEPTHFQRVNRITINPTTLLLDLSEADSQLIDRIAEIFAESARPEYQTAGNQTFLDLSRAPPEIASRVWSLCQGPQEIGLPEAFERYAGIMRGEQDGLTVFEFHNVPQEVYDALVKDSDMAPIYRALPRPEDQKYFELAPGASPPALHPCETHSLTGVPPDPRPMPSCGCEPVSAPEWASADASRSGEGLCLTSAERPEPPPPLYFTEQPSEPQPVPKPAPRPVMPPQPRLSEPEVPPWVLMVQEREQRRHGARPSLAFVGKQRDEEGCEHLVFKVGADTEE